MAINFLILDIKPQGIQTLFKIQFFFPNVANYLEEWQFVDTPPHTHTLNVFSGISSGTPTSWLRKTFLPAN